MNVYPLIRSVLVCGMVDQYEHNKSPGLVFIGTLTNLMWPQHIESSSVSCFRIGQCIVAANKDYLVPISGCLGFDRTSNFLEKICNMIKKTTLRRRLMLRMIHCYCNVNLS